MTVAAIELRVFAGQREFRLPVVIEIPDAPAVGRMAGGAVAAEAAFVYIAASMAGNAVVRGAGIRARGVALATSNDHVHAQQRERAEIVIERQPRFPAHRSVAGFASHPLRAGVNVITPMAAGAILRQLLHRKRCGVARVAIERGVAARKFEVALHGVIEGRHPPGVVAVATGAILAEPRGVRVRAAMASHAGARQFVVELSAAMAAGAVERRVAAQQREVRFLRVIETRGFP